MKRILSLVLALFLFLGFSAPVLAHPQVPGREREIARYYPIIESEEWKEMDRDSRVEACQIPADSLTTAELLNTILACPLMIDLYAFDTYSDGFNSVYHELPALKVLAERKDFGAVLSDFYISLPVASASDCSNIMEMSITEILIAQPEMTDALSQDVLESLVNTAAQKRLEKSSTMSTNGGNLNTFYEAAHENPDSAISLAISTVKTPKGSSVSVYDNSSIVDWSASEKAELNATYDAMYPTATRISGPTKKYNCHSYAWYSTSSSNRYWMDDPSLYMEDGSYTKTTSSKNGNKVYWAERTYAFPEHSGILAENMQSSPYISCNSKWGQLGVYNHPLDDCPYSGTRSYWTR